MRRSSQLESIARYRNYGGLPETWWVPDIDRFSAGKTLYDCQTDAFGWKDALTDCRTYEDGKLEIKFKNLYPAVS